MHFENEIEHKILVTYVIAKVSDYEKAGSLQARAKEIETLLLEKLERWEMLEGKQNGGGDFEGSGSLIGVEISSVVYTFGFCLKTRLSTQK